MRRALTLLFCFLVPLSSNCAAINLDPGEAEATILLKECIHEAGVEPAKMNELTEIYKKTDNMSFDQLLEATKEILEPEQNDLYLLCFASRYLKATVSCSRRIEMTHVEKDELRRGYSNLHEAIISKSDFPQQLEETVGRERAERFKTCGLLVTLFSQEEV